MLHPDETRKLIRTGRIQNARHFFFADPLGALDTIQQLHIPVANALHAFGPSLRAARPETVWTESAQQLTEETAQAIEEARAAAYCRDYDEGVERTLALTGKAYSGD